jgi:hypothetical protein
MLALLPGRSVYRSLDVLRRGFRRANVNNCLLKEAAGLRAARRALHERNEFEAEAL